MESIVKISFFNAIVTFLYIVAVALFFYYARIVNLGVENTFLIPIAMLMLFVFSAAFTGILVFGRPAIWYLEGKKREALLLLAYTLCIFFLLMIFVFFSLIFFFT